MLTRCPSTTASVTRASSSRAVKVAAALGASRAPDCSASISAPSVARLSPTISRSPRDGATRRWATAFPSPTSRRATPSSSPTRSPGPRCSGPRTSSSASMRSTTPAIPIAGPEFIEAFERMANLATQAGVEGRSRFAIHAPLITLTKAQIVARGLELGVDFVAHLVVLRAGAPMAAPAASATPVCSARRASRKPASPIPSPRPAEAGASRLAPAARHLLARRSRS